MVAPGGSENQRNRVDFGAKTMPAWIQRAALTLDKHYVHVTATYHYG